MNQAEFSETFPNCLHMITKSNSKFKKMSQEPQPPPTHTEKVNDCKRTNTRQLLNIPTRKLRWLVKNAAPIPDLPLETHGRIPINGTTALTVASRIEECLRKRSIDVEFNADAAQAKCKTENFVIYKIYLYQGVVKKNTIIVEVQRWKGCGIEFIHERNVIFSAAKGFGIDDFVTIQNLSSTRRSGQICMLPFKTLNSGISLIYLSIN
jgi:hypothetical protein